jgi:hypothetical protein
VPALILLQIKVTKMRKNIALSFIVLFSISVFISCGKKDGNSTLPTKFDLSYKFSKGDKFKYKLTTITTSEESIQTDSTMHAKSVQTDAYVMEFEVIDVDADKIAEMNVNFTTMKVDADANGQKISFDASKNPGKEDQQKFWQYYIQYQVPFRARINSKGEVIEVSRLDKMIDRMNSLQPQKRELSAPEKVKLSQELGESVIRPLTQLVFRELPQKQMSKDSSWQKVYPSQLSVFKIMNTAEYKIENLTKVDGDNIINIGVSLNINWQGEKKGQQQGIKFDFDDPKVSGNGSVTFNYDKGLVNKSETSTTVELVARIEGINAMQKAVKTVRKDLSTNKNIIELLPE